MFLFKQSFEDIASNFGDPRCYWDFPSCALAFSKSLKTSSLLHIETETGSIFFRKGKTALKLITFFCDEEDLIRELKILINKGYSIKSLPFAGKNIKSDYLKKDKVEFFTDKNWSIENVKKKCTKNERKQINHSFNRCREKYYEDENLELKEVLDLINVWLKEASGRHFMVRKGHHNKYIENFFKKGNNVNMFGLRRKKDDALFGVSGFEIFKGNAQFTIFKHRMGDNPFSKYMRILALEKAVGRISDNGRIYSGSSSDVAKKSLGLDTVRTYKLDIGKL